MQDRCMVCARQGSEIILTHLMELLGDVGHVESPSFPLEIVLMSVQDRCMVCARRTIGSTRSSFWPFGHGANLDAR